MSGENKRNVRPVKVGGLTLDGKKYISNPCSMCRLRT